MTHKMADFRLIHYTPSLKEEWDNFVETSKNGTFMLKRGFMDYHADRFPDHSLMAYRDDRLYALLPATASGSQFFSHSGLTYGGLITDKKANSKDILSLFNHICQTLSAEGFTSFHYTPAPHIYHRLPSEEDLYALFRLNATLSKRLISSVICQSDRIKFRDIRKAGIRKARKNKVTLRRSFNFAPFWQILSENLSEKYGEKPVHSLSEISLLASRFPENIALYTAEQNGETIAGVVMFISTNVAHTQYITASPVGKSIGALDFLFDHLINSEFNHMRYFDFGTSCEDGGRILNESLIYQKEGFGARGICYDSYTINLMQPEFKSSKIDTPLGLKNLSDTL